MISQKEGIYHCSCCGHTWKAGKRYLYWPIRFGWREFGPIGFIDWHGWEVGYYRPSIRLFGWTLHIGRLLIKFGKSEDHPGLIYVPDYGWWSQKEAERLEEWMAN